MSNMNKKETIIVSVVYILFSVFFSYAQYHWFSLIYFGAIALVIAFADKIFSENKFVSLPNSLTIACIAAVCNSTLHEIFYSEHGNLEQFTAAFAVAVFLAGIVASTVPSNLPYAIVAAPLICFLNLRIALCYCILLASICFVNICLNKHVKITPKKQKKGTKSAPDFNIIAIVVCVISLAICIFRFIKSDFSSAESFVYFKNNFKNAPAVIIFDIYLLIRLLKSEFKAKSAMLISTGILLAMAITGTIFISWALLSLSFLCIMLLLLHCFIQDNNCFEIIKEDYQSHKFIFWVLMLLLLQ